MTQFNPAWPSKTPTSNCPITAGIPNLREICEPIVVEINIRHKIPINSILIIPLYKI
ncbi:UNVERIFIED_ORG: hypothetical protein QQG_3513 [Clostridioides difficile Y384]